MSDAIIAEHSTKISRLEYWRNGNGTKGAAAIIDEHEKRIDKAEKAIALHEATEQHVIEKAVKRALTERSHSVEGILRALGPYFAAIASIIIAILSQGGQA